MSSAQSLLQIAFAFALMFALGLGPALQCFPAPMRARAPFAAPAAGYVLFCLASIWISSWAGIAQVRANLWALCALLAWSVLACVRHRASLPDLRASVRPIAALVVLMMALVFMPVVDLGTDLYLGTVNPDFLQSLALQQSLADWKLPFWGALPESPRPALFYQLLFPEQFQARFGAVAFALMLQQVTGAGAPAALTTSLVAFVLCLPLAVYLFSRDVLEFSPREAFLAAALAAVSASTTMSFVHALVGQNSALATFPLAITLVYAAIRHRSVALALLAGAVLNGIFWIYVMVLPYVLAPFGPFLVLRAWRQGWRATAGFWIAGAAIAALTLAVHAGIAAQTGRFVHDLAGLVKGISLSGFYRDFLTEDVFIYATGLSSFSIAHSRFAAPWLEMAWPLFKVLAFVLAGAYFVALRRWEKEASRDAALLVLSLLGTYLAVWFHYTFFTRYGYASFKMVAWLQFAAVPFFAWLLARSWDVLAAPVAPPHGRRGAVALFALLAAYVVLNILSVVDYGSKSYGRDLMHGSLVNSYGISGNRDFPALEAALAKQVAPGSRLALGFSDYIENLVAAYYIRNLGVRASLLAHDRLPDDDSFLPDVRTRRSLDTSGRETVYEPAHFDGGEADYYLLPAPGDLNRDIVSGGPAATPAWSSATFMLYRRADVADLAFTGRGFFRIEHLDTSALPWWWPATFRWTAEGGEIYHLMPSRAGGEYRLGFRAIAGLGVPSGTRTIEVWHNGVKFDELVMHGAARLLTRPYRPVPGVNRLVLKVREKAALGENRYGLWNRDLPRSVRQLNVLVADVTLRPADAPAGTVFGTGRGLKAKELLEALDTYDGFDVDGWLRDRARFSLRVAPDARTMTMKILVPGNLGFAFPFHVAISLNGRNEDRDFAAPGEHEVRIALPQSPPAGGLAVEIAPQAAARRLDGMEQREVVQSIRLGELGIFK